MGIGVSGTLARRFHGDARSPARVPEATYRNRPLAGPWIAAPRNRATPVAVSTSSTGTSKTMRSFVTRVGGNSSSRPSCTAKGTPAGGSQSVKRSTRGRAAVVDMRYADVVGILQTRAFRCNALIYPDDLLNTARQLADGRAGVDESGTNVTALILPE